MNIYAPIADRLGMSQLCLELEMLAFRELHPTAFMEIVIDHGQERLRAGARARGAWQSFWCQQYLTIETN